jgi:hypothetical protein
MEYTAARKWRIDLTRSDGMMASTVAPPRVIGEWR